MLTDGTVRYSLQEPFEYSVQSICASLRSRGMRVSGQLDVSRRLERSVGIVVGSCKIVFVLPDPSTLSAETIHPWAAVFLPLHIVISGDDRQSEIRIPNAVQTGRNINASARYAPVVEAQRQIIVAIEAVAVRPSILA